ncbi:MAG: phosphotransferase, partial [Desulfovibrionaceae bacterium]
TLHRVEYSPVQTLQPVYIAQDMLMYEQQSGFVCPEHARARLLEYAREFDAAPQVLCHRDLLLENILIISEGTDIHVQLIDFEYAGFTHPLWDVASFILEADMSMDQRAEFAMAYGLPPDVIATALARMEIVVDYVWGLWGLVNGYGEYGKNRLHRAFTRLSLAHEPRCTAH